jgi:hypothetical protein
MRAGERLAVVVLVGSALTATVAHADDPPPFQSVRADENYAAAADPAWRARLPEPWKFVALDATGERYASFGGEVRERFDTFDAARFGIGGVRPDSYVLQRFLLHADLHVGSRLRFFVQVGHHDALGKRPPYLPVDRDPTDLQNAFLDVVPDTAGRFTLRIGRQELLLNPTQRFVGVREGPNLRQSYDGVRVRWARGPWTADAWTLRPVTAKPGAFDDRGDPTVRFSGVYASRRVEGLAGSVDGWWFALDRFGAKYGAAVGAERRRGLGARLVARPGAWDVEAEFLWQYGTFGRADLRAWGGGLDVGRTYAVRAHPRLGLRLDGASGGRLDDPNRIGTFNPLFPKGAYFDESTLTTYANLLAVRPSVTVSPARGVTVQLAQAWRWRENRDDALYLIPFVAIPATAGRGGRYVGRFTTLDTQWRVNRWISLQALYLHVAAGSAVTQAGGHDADFGMLIGQLKF